MFGGPYYRRWGYAEPADPIRLLEAQGRAGGQTWTKMRQERDQHGIWRATGGRHLKEGNYLGFDTWTHAEELL